MNGTLLCINRGALPMLNRLALTGLLLIGFAASQPSRAESTLSAGPAAGGPLSASAHLNFRVTILPSLTLSMLPNGLRIQSNGGVVVLQHERRDATNTSPAVAGSRLPLRHQVMDVALSNASFPGSNLITLATP